MINIKDVALDAAAEASLSQNRNKENVPCLRVECRHENPFDKFLFFVNSLEILFPVGCLIYSLL